MARTLAGRLLGALLFAALLLLPCTSTAGSDAAASGTRSGATSDAQGDPPSGSTEPTSGPTPTADPDEPIDLQQEDDLGGLFLEDPILTEAPLELYLFDEEDLVEAASRKSSKLSEAPGTITLLQREQIDALGALTLQDLLGYLNSTQILPGTIDSAVEFRGVQQPFNNKILMLQDGRVLNNTYRGDFFLGLAQPLDDVQRVEVVRGPGSALYGANAFAGFINLVTVKGEDVDGLESRTALGDDGLWYQNLLAGGKTQKIDWLVRGRATSANLPAPALQDPDGKSEQDGDLRGRLSGDTWFVDVGMMELKADSPGSFRFPTEHDRFEIQQFHVDGRKEWSFGEKLESATGREISKFKIAVRSYYNDADNTYEFVSLDLPNCDGANPYCAVTVDAMTDLNIVDIVDPDGNQIPESVRKQYGITLNTPGHLRVKDDLGDPDVYIDRATYDAWRNGELGNRVETQASRERRAFAEFQFDWKVSRSNYLLMGAGMSAEILRNSEVGDHTFRDYFGWIEDEQRFLNDQLIVHGSVRFDSHSWFGDTASPRLSLIYAPKFGKGAARLVSRARPPFYLKAGFGRAFRSPNFVELFGQTRVGPAVDMFDTEAAGVAFLRGNEDLEQESIDTYELQLHWEPAKSLQTTLTFFDYSMENEVILNVDRDVVFAVQDSRIPIPGVHDLVFDESLAAVPVSAEFINISEGTEGHGLEFNLVWRPGRGGTTSSSAAAGREHWYEGFTLWSNYSRLHVDRPVERELLIVTNPESAALVEQGFRVRREGGLLDGMNLGLLYQGRNDRWMVHYRARAVGKLGSSLFSRGGAVAHDLTLGIKAGNFTARLSGLNLTGEDLLRDPTDGSYPDLDAEWKVLFGYRWEF